MEYQHTNRLIHETSPYLLQHAHNPVDWYPWKEEALEREGPQQRDAPTAIGEGVERTVGRRDERCVESNPEAAPAAPRDETGEDADDERRHQRVRRAAMPEGRAVRDVEMKRDDVDVGEERKGGEADHAKREGGRAASSVGARSEAAGGHSHRDVSEARHPGSGLHADDTHDVRDPVRVRELRGVGDLR